MSEKKPYRPNWFLTQLGFYYPETVKEIEDHPNKDIRQPAKAGFKLLDNVGFIIDRIQ